MHAFIDAFVIGEGEEVIQEIIDRTRSKERQKQRHASTSDRTCSPA